MILPWQRSSSTEESFIVAMVADIARPHSVSAVDVKQAIGHTNNAARQAQCQSMMVGLHSRPPHVVWGMLPQSAAVGPQPSSSIF